MVFMILFAQLEQHEHYLNFILLEILHRSAVCEAHIKSVLLHLFFAKPHFYVMLRLFNLLFGKPHFYIFTFKTFWLTHWEASVLRLRYDSVDDPVDSDTVLLSLLNCKILGQKYRHWNWFADSDTISGV